MFMLRSMVGSGFAKQLCRHAKVFRPHRRMMSQVVSADLQQDSRTVIASWDEGATSQYPYLFLRDNCQCEACLHPGNKGRLFLIRHLQPDTKPQSVQKSDKGLSITWADGHVSEYDSKWLKDHEFSEAGKMIRSQWQPRKPMLWGSELQDNIPRLEFDKVINDDKTLFDWILHMETVGLCVLTGATTQTGQVERIGNRVAFLKNQSYGLTFTVKSSPNPTNVAYTGATLGLHTDLPYYHYAGGVQMLHCICQVKSEGGDNEFADSFQVAEQMRAEQPEHFQTLSTVPVDFNDVGNDAYKFHLHYRTPVFKLDSEGNVEKTTYNNHMRASALNADIGQVEPLYRAMIALDRVLHSDRNMVKVKLNDGEIVCFHNYRVMHGRAGYRTDSGEARHLEGGFLDWDELYSRRRVLQAELGLQLEEE